MPFIGNQPALSFTSFAKQDFTTSATTSYTLDNPVANANELALFINFVRQEPTTAYSASGTTLTLTSATSVGDDMYCVYLGKAVQTVNPPNASVGASQIVDASITSAKIANDAVDNTKLDLTNDYSFTGKISGQNYPAFFVNISGNQTVSDQANTKIPFNSEVVDTDGAFDNSTNYRFTIPTGKDGKYLFFYHAQVSSATASQSRQLQIRLQKNGSNIYHGNDKPYINDATRITMSGSFIHDCSAGDYFELYAQMDTGTGNVSIEAGTSGTSFGGFRIGD